MHRNSREMAVKAREQWKEVLIIRWLIQAPKSSY